MTIIKYLSKMLMAFVSQINCAIYYIVIEPQIITAIIVAFEKSVLQTDL